MNVPDRSDLGSALTIFLHVPKTAGTTFDHAMFGQYSTEQVCLIYPKQARFPDGRKVYRPEEIGGLPAEELRQYSLVAGHVIYGIHRQFKRPAIYFSIMRDPVQRISSLYNHLRSNGTIPAGVDLERILGDLTEFPWSRQFTNQQYAILGGEHPQKGLSDAAALDAIKQKIDQDFAFIGTTERFDETVVMAAQRFGWTQPAYVSVNIRRKSGTTWAVDDKTLDLIRQANRLDLLLYDYVAARFDAQLAAQPAGFADEVAALRERNREARQQRAARK